MFKIFKKMITGSPQEKKIEEDKPSLVEKIHQKVEGIIGFINLKTKETIDEFGDVKAKVSNLLETNYNLGLKHLDKGNISDAVFRFRFVKKFWPEYLDAHYQLAYSLALNKKPYEAKKILTELLLKNPNYDPKARALLDKINQEKISND